MAKKKSPAGAAASRTRAGHRDATPNPSREEIAEAAYRRYLSRGSSDGADFNDWIEAERELRTRRTR